MAITSFSLSNSFLSNFYPSVIKHEGISYPCVENAFQAYKTTCMPLRQAFIMPAPGVAKKMGQAVILRKDWEKVKLGVMRELLQLKFADLKLKEKLLATGDQDLIEGNSWNDTYWGVCNGTGDNHLGKLLMEIRGQGIRRAL